MMEKDRFYFLEMQPQGNCMMPFVNIFMMEIVIILI